MLIMLPHVHACSTLMIRPTDPEVYHPNHDVYLNDPGKDSNMRDCFGFTTGGCSGKRVSIPLIVTLLVSLPSGCHAVNSMEVLAVASTLAHLTDGPTAILQWLLYKKAPSVAATLESYRWEPLKNGNLCQMKKVKQPSKIQKSLNMNCLSLSSPHQHNGLLSPGCVPRFCFCIT